MNSGSIRKGIQEVKAMLIMDSDDATDGVL